MGILVSVNVGLPRELEWEGRRVRTSVWKQPVSGRVRVTRLNLDGDRQADLHGHGGVHRAVMVYQLGSYAHWAEHFKRSDLVHGNFGENFTVDGLADDEVCIGDRFRIGGAVFEVSQPRVTCYRVGLRLNVPDMAALLVSHGRPGFYLRVLEEGDVGAGDRIAKIADGPERMTVTEMDALLYSAHHPLEGLRRAVRIPALSPGWQRSFQALLEAAENGEQGNAGLAPAASPPLSWSGFRSLKVTEIQQESIDVRSFVLADVDGAALPPALPGQYVALRLGVAPAAAPVFRTYSLCGSHSTGTYRIAVKNEGGAGSHFMHNAVRAGDRLDVSAPRGAFTLRPGAGPVVLLSAGIGITPLLAMLRAVAEGAAPRTVWWFHAARDKAHDAFGGEVRALMARLPDSHFCNIHSRPGADDPPGAHYDLQGHLSVALLRERGVPSDADFYLCGPPRFLEDMQEGLKAWPVERARIHTELFGATTSLQPGIVGEAILPPHLPPGAPGTGPTVSFLRSGVTLHWDDRFHSLLELAEACAVPVRWSCRSGVCHNCESGLVDGRLRYSPTPLDPPPEGIALICCAVPASDITLDL